MYSSRDAGRRARGTLPTRAAIAVALVAGSASLSHAAGEAVGSGNVYVGPQRSSTARSNGFASWNAHTRVVVMRATGYGMAAGKCETTWFDWGVSRGHFDIRSVRNCYRTPGTHSGTSTETAGRDFSFVGVQKFAVCYGNNNSLEGCQNSTYATMPLGSVNAVYNRSNFTTRWWLKNAAGQVDYFDGGNSREPNR